jgi:hypothetical protein
MAPEAFIGLPGDFVRLVEPHTEADPIALLGNFLVASGVLFGRDAYAVADGKEHYPVEFLLTVGETGASGRKGTATARTKPVMERTDEGFSRRVLSGLSSAEGLIKAVSPQTADELTIPGERGHYQENPDRARRYLAELAEFATLLTVMKREGNTMSSLLRQAWDADRLRVLTRKEPLDADNVNLSVIAHITPAELLNGLTLTDRANGFANRFLMILVRRSKSLPEGGGDVNYSPIVTRLHAAVEAAQGRGVLRRDESAKILWADEYERLTRPREGLCGALCGRAEAHALRLSLLYSLLDGAPAIRVEHLKAGIAFWDYCERSIEHIFGNATGDAEGEKIVRALASGPMNMTDLLRLFNNNRTTDWIGAKMAMLCRSGKAFQTTKEGERKSGILAWGLRPVAAGNRC